MTIIRLLLRAVVTRIVITRHHRRMIFTRHRDTRRMSMRTMLCHILRMIITNHRSIQVYRRSLIAWERVLAEKTLKVFGLSEAPDHEVPLCEYTAMV